MADIDSILAEFNKLSQPSGAEIISVEFIFKDIKEVVTDSKDKSIVKNKNMNDIKIRRPN